MTLKARKQHCPVTEQEKTGLYWRLNRKEYMHTSCVPGGGQREVKMQTV